MEYMITLLPQGQKITGQAGQTLLSALRAQGLGPDAPCGGNGTCGKCTVLVQGVPVRTCQYRLTGDVTVRFVEKEDTTRVLAEGYGARVPMDPLRPGYLLCYDIGTTTVVCYLLREGTGELAATRSAVNPQQRFGADVISRIQCALSGDQDRLTNLIRQQMAAMMDQVCRQAGIRPNRIGVVSVVGNPCMQQLFLGIPPQNLAAIPFSPVLTQTQTLPAAEYLPGCESAVLLVVPDISGYVGADTIGCVLATELDLQESMTLLVDIGTNGEMILGNRDRMTACATAAGPALEGARIRCGMRGADGAIDHVWLEDGDIAFSVIGNSTPRGICGSGLIDAAALLVQTGLVNRRGRLQTDHSSPALASRLRNEDGHRSFRLSDTVFLTQEDIREIQMAKGAIAAGIELMTHHLELQTEQIDRVLLAGAFGSYIQPESACRIGLLPPQLLPKIQAVGNAAGSGARRLACNQAELRRAQAISERTEFLELAAMPGFQRRFAQNMEFRL